MKKIKNFLTSQVGVKVISSLVAIFIGIFVGFLLMLAVSPSEAFTGLYTILFGTLSFDGLRGIGDVLYFAAPIILTGLSVGFAFKTGLFNIGASGQFIMGAFFGLVVGINWTFLPAGIHWIVAILAAILGGAIIGAIPGLLKAYFNVNEVISSIMLNYISMYFVNMMIKASPTLFNQDKNTSNVPANSAMLPKWGLDKIFPGSSVNIGIFIAIAAAIIIALLLNKTKLGYELKACGLNKDAANYAGVNEKRTIVISMIIAGALAGLAGGITYLVSAGKMIQIVDVLAAEGFNGIPVALLGHSSPIAIIFSGIFMAYIQQSGFNLQLLSYNEKIISIIIAIIVYGSAFSLFITNFIMRVKAKKGGRK